MKLRSIFEAIVLTDTNENILKAISDIRNLGSPNPFDPGETIIDNSVGVEISKFDGAVWLSSIRTFDPGKGNASNVLKKICDIADKHSVKIKLNPKPYGNEGLKKSQLIAWYKRNGFVDNKRGNMERLPK